MIILLRSIQRPALDLVGFSVLSSSGDPCLKTLGHIPDYSRNRIAWVRLQECLIAFQSLPPLMGRAKIQIGLSFVHSGLDERL